MSVPKYRPAKSIGSLLSGGNERRRACRYHIALPDSSLGWWEESLFVSTPCRLIDLSMAGCMVESRSLPGRTETPSVWFRPQGVSPDDWTAGIIVAARKPLFREWQIRIGFLAPFPYESFKSLVFGREIRREIPERDPPEHEKDHFWT